jgi:hypothetical protein
MLEHVVSFRRRLVGNSPGAGSSGSNALTPRHADRAGNPTKSAANGGINRVGCVFRAQRPINPRRHDRCPSSSSFAVIRPDAAHEAWRISCSFPIMPPSHRPGFQIMSPSRGRIRAFASDGRRNLKGSAKAEMLSRLFPAGFVYAGDSAADLKVQAALSLLTRGAPSPRRRAGWESRCWNCQIGSVRN